MAGQTERGMMAERVAAIVIWTGATAMLCGLVLLAAAVMGEGPIGEAAAGPLSLRVLPGGVVVVLGLGLVLRGMTLNLAAETLANVRLLQEEMHRARTQAAVHAHARREPSSELVPSAEIRKPAASAALANGPVTPKPKVKVMTAPPMPVAARPAAQPDRKASKAEPIRGKPFQPHPIFMARPPR
jgi:hypothetical protein